MDGRRRRPGLLKSCCLVLSLQAVLISAQMSSFPLRQRTSFTPAGSSLVRSRSGLVAPSSVRRVALAGGRTRSALLTSRQRQLQQAQQRRLTNAGLSSRQSALRSRPTVVVDRFGRRLILKRPSVSQSSILSRLQSKRSQQLASQQAGQLGGRPQTLLTRQTQTQTADLVNAPQSPQSPGLRQQPSYDEQHPGQLPQDSLLSQQSSNSMSEQRPLLQQQSALLPQQHVPTSQLSSFDQEQSSLLPQASLSDPHHVSQVSGQGVHDPRQLSGRLRDVSRLSVHEAKPHSQYVASPAQQVQSQYLSQQVQQGSGADSSVLSTGSVNSGLQTIQEHGHLQQAAHSPQQTLVQSQPSTPTQPASHTAAVQGHSGVGQGQGQSQVSSNQWQPQYEEVLYVDSDGKVLKQTVQLRATGTAASSAVALTQATSHLPQQTAAAMAAAATSVSSGASLPHATSHIPQQAVQLQATGTASVSAGSHVSAGSQTRTHTQVGGNPQQSLQQLSAQQQVTGHAQTLHSSADPSSHTTLTGSPVQTVNSNHQVHQQASQAVSPQGHHSTHTASVAHQASVTHTGLHAQGGAQSGAHYAASNPGLVGSAPHDPRSSGTVHSATQQQYAHAAQPAAAHPPPQQHVMQGAQPVHSPPQQHFAHPVQSSPQGHAVQGSQAGVGSAAGYAGGGQYVQTGVGAAAGVPMHGGGVGMSGMGVPFNPKAQSLEVQPWV